MHGQNQDELVSRVTKIRREEDLSFASASGIRMEFLELMDAPLRGIKNPLGERPRASDLDYVTMPLNKCMASIHEKFGDGSLLLAPMGIGSHVDHLTLRDWVLHNLGKLSSRYRIGFYEDLHYASRRELRLAGLHQFRQLIPERLACRRVRIPLEGDVLAKLKLIEIYSSQLLGEKPSLANFSPAEDPDLGPHEAIWMIEAKAD